jgi:hypothetical protein
MAEVFFCLLMKRHFILHKFGFFYLFISASTANNAEFGECNGAGFPSFLPLLLLWICATSGR